MPSLCHSALIIGRACGLVADLIVVILTWRRTTPAKLAPGVDFKFALGSVLFNNGMHISHHPSHPVLTGNALQESHISCERSPFTTISLTDDRG